MRYFLSYCLLSERPRIHINWLWKKLCSYRGSSLGFASLKVLWQYLNDESEFSIDEDGYCKILPQTKVKHIADDISCNKTTLTHMTVSEVTTVHDWF